MYLSVRLGLGVECKDIWLHSLPNFGYILSCFFGYILSYCKVKWLYLNKKFNDKKIKIKNIKREVLSIFYICAEFLIRLLL